MSYLARLKRLDGNENFTHTPQTVLPKLTKAPSVSSVSSIQGHIENIFPPEKTSVSFVSSIQAPIEKITPSKNDDVFQAEITVDRNSFILPTIADTDDRRTCQQCLNLRGRVCAIAKPQAGSLVVANVGYRPQADTLQRCAGYLPNATDNDQRTGGERWPGLANTKGTK
jgi:hypothetical protein